MISPQVDAVTTENPQFFFGVGNVAFEFPFLNTEREFFQTASEESLQRKPMEQMYYDVLSQTRNLYLARELCWKFQFVRGVDSLVLQPATDTELVRLIAALDPDLYAKTDVFFSVIVGQRMGLSKPELCNGLELPLIYTERVMSISFAHMKNYLVTKMQISDDEAADLLVQLTKLTNNTGETDNYRAINYLVFNYLSLYEITYGNGRLGFTLSRVITQESKLRGKDKYLDVIFEYQNGSSLKKFICTVDVSGSVPFVQRPLTEYVELW